MSDIHRRGPPAAMAARGADACPHARARGFPSPYGGGRGRCRGRPTVPRRGPGFGRRRGGPHDWAPLLFLTYSRIPGAPPKRDAVAFARLLLGRGADPDTHFIANGRYVFSAMTGAIGEGEVGLLNLPPHENARELLLLLLAAGANPNESQGLYNTHFRPDDAWLELLLANGLTSTAPAN